MERCGHRYKEEPAAGLDDCKRHRRRAFLFDTPPLTPATVRRSPANVTAAEVSTSCRCRITAVQFIGSPTALPMLLLRRCLAFRSARPLLVCAILTSALRAFWKGVDHRFFRHCLVRAAVDRGSAPVMNDGELNLKSVNNAAILVKPFSLPLSANRPRPISVRLRHCWRAHFGVDCCSWSGATRSLTSHRGRIGKDGPARCDACRHIFFTT